MSFETKKTEQKIVLLDWVEPKVASLDVSETHSGWGSGGDGGTGSFTNS